MTLHPDVKPEYLKKLKFITSGAAPLGPSDEERFLEKFGTNMKIGQGTVHSILINKILIHI